jgi:hypothetical protein
MQNRIDPAEFGLPSRTILVEGQKGEIILVMDRKSRIVMADGHRIAAKAEKIRSKNPAAEINLQTGAPICGKTASYLAAKDIKIFPLEE